MKSVNKRIKMSHRIENIKKMIRKIRNRNREIRNRE